MILQIEQVESDVIHVGRRMYDRGYVASNDGNLSVRLSEDRLLITMAGVSKGFLDRDKFVIVDYDGAVISGKHDPSSEMKMHLMVYRERPDVHAVAHAHPPAATGFSVAGVHLPDALLPEVIVSLGFVPIAPYGTPGTMELVESLRGFVRNHDAVLLENHGALTLGPDIISAYHKMETMEHCAQITLVARMLGQVNSIGQENVDKLHRLYGRPFSSGGNEGYRTEETT